MLSSVHNIWTDDVELKIIGIIMLTGIEIVQNLSSPQSLNAKSVGYGYNIKAE
jgi:hypothetical protein